MAKRLQSSSDGFKPQSTVSRTVNSAEYTFSLHEPLIPNLGKCPARPTVCFFHFYLGIIDIPALSSPQTRSSNLRKKPLECLCSGGEDISKSRRSAFKKRLPFCEEREVTQRENKIGATRGRLSGTSRPKESVGSSFSKREREHKPHGRSHRTINLDSKTIN